MRRASTLLGCGCAVVIAFFLAAVLSVTWATYRAGRDFERVARDPEAAAERAREVVAFAELPEGYRAFGALSVPLLLDVAFFLAPIEGSAGAAAGEAAVGETEPLRVDRGFLYIRLRDWMGRGDELEESMLGQTSDEAELAQEGLDFRPKEVVGRGSLRLDGADVTWLARRGDVTIDPDSFGGGEAKVTIGSEELTEVDYSAEGAGEGTGVGGAAGAAGEPLPGVLTLLAFDCPGGDSWHRLGVWFAPDPAPEVPAAEVDWSGTPGDPEAIAAFLDRFELCG